MAASACCLAFCVKKLLLRSRLFGPNNYWFSRSVMRTVLTTRLFSAGRSSGLGNPQKSFAENSTGKMNGPLENTGPKSSCSRGWTSFTSPVIDTLLINVQLVSSRRLLIITLYTCTKLESCPALPLERYSDRRIIYSTAGRKRWTCKR